MPQCAWCSQQFNPYWSSRSPVRCCSLRCRKARQSFMARWCKSSVAHRPGPLGHREVALPAVWDAEDRIARRELIRRARRGDRAALEELATRWHVTSWVVEGRALIREGVPV